MQNQRQMQTCDTPRSSSLLLLSAGEKSIHKRCPNLSPFWHYQFGREQASGPEPKGGPGVWEHRLIGVEAFGPNALGKQAMVFKGNHPGTFKVYLDNLQILHADGTTTPIWLGQKDTRTSAIQNTKPFKNVQLRTVPLASAK